jgi:hypothetical protein
MGIYTGYSGNQTMASWELLEIWRFPDAAISLDWCNLGGKPVDRMINDCRIWMVHPMVHPYLIHVMVHPYLVGGFKHGWRNFPFHIWDFHPSHWRTPSFFKMVIAPPTRYWSLLKHGNGQFPIDSPQIRGPQFPEKESVRPCKERVVFMTTNHYHALPRALVRRPRKLSEEIIPVGFPGGEDVTVPGSKPIIILYYIQYS